MSKTYFSWQNIILLFYSIKSAFNHKDWKIFKNPSGRRLYKYLWGHFNGNWGDVDSIFGMIPECGGWDPMHIYKNADYIRWLGKSESDI